MEVPHERESRVSRVRSVALQRVAAGAVRRRSGTNQSADAAYDFHWSRARTYGGATTTCRPSPGDTDWAGRVWQDTTGPANGEPIARRVLGWCVAPGVGVAGGAGSRS